MANSERLIQSLNTKYHIPNTRYLIPNTQNLYQIKAYIKFLLQSKNQHGVHSPFVYELVTKCFYDTQNHTEYSKLKAYRNSLLQNSTSIHITDFGSGSKVFSSNMRSIRQIAKTSGTTIKRARLLYRLVGYFNPQHILELGTSLGIGSYAMAMANPKTRLTSIEGCPEISKVAAQQLKIFEIENVSLKTGAFSDVVPRLNHQSWDLVFFDGHHNKKATLTYFEQLLPTIHNDSLFIFDDIHWSIDMTECWEIIKQHPKVSVTIDTFYWGFVFFKPSLAKEHFTIRL